MTFCSQVSTMKHTERIKGSTYAAHTNAVLVDGTPLYDVGLQDIVDLWHKLECQCLEDRGRRNAMRKKVIKLGPNLQNLSRCSFLNDFIGDDFNQRLPVRRRNRCLLVDIVAVDQVSQQASTELASCRFILLRVHRLEHQESSPQISSTVLSYPHRQRRIASVSLVFANLRKHRRNVLDRWRSYSY